MNFPHTYYDFIAPRDYYAQHNNFDNNKGYMDPLQESFNTDPRNKLSRRPITKPQTSYNDQEAIELATVIVNNYVTMRETGGIPSNPILDTYFNNGEASKLANNS